MVIVKSLVPGNIMLVGEAASESLRKFSGVATDEKSNAEVSVCFI
jgi:predicted phosphoadenosine phosphosulfate sulfurtransferase